MKTKSSLMKAVFVWGFFLSLSVPFIVHISAPFHLYGEKILNENRALTEIRMPETMHDIIQFPDVLQKWVNDSFGLRTWFVSFNNNLQYSLFQDIPRFDQCVAIGQDGFIFLGSHIRSMPMSAMAWYVGISAFPALREETLQRQLEKSKHISDRMVYVSVPTTHILDTEQYPAWLADLAIRRRESVIRSLTALQEQTSGKFLYPYKEALELKKHHQLIPKTFFHWVSGPYTRMVAALAAKQLKISKGNEAEVPEYRKEARPSDIESLYPGLRAFVSDVETYKQHYFSDKGVTQEKFLFPALDSMPNASKIMKRTLLMKNPNIQSTNRLLLIGDSFALPILEDFSDYFSQVVHVTHNEFSALTPDEQKEYIEGLLQSFKPTHCVQITHVGYPEFHDELINKFFLDLPPQTL